MEFEWDIRKNKQNIEKHGIDFSDAALVFEHPMLEYEDVRQNYGERRFFGIGIIQDIEVAVVYTRRGNKLRLISARRARKDERQYYRSLHPKNVT